MTTRFIVRLLSDQDALLAWAEVYATAHPQVRGGSCPFFATAPTQFVIEQSGTVAKLSVHWADLDVARVRDQAPVDVLAGQVFDFTWIEPVWLVPGMRDVPLPAVTVRKPVVIEVPAGGLGLKSSIH